MNILIVAEGRFPDFTGGAELVIHHLGKYLAGHGHTVHTVTRKAKKTDKSEDVIDNIRVHRFPTPCKGTSFHKLYPLFSFCGARKLFLKLMKAISFDVIIFNQPFPALGILSCSKNKDAKKIYIFHSLTVGEYMAAKNREKSSITIPDKIIIHLLTKIERYALKKSQKIVALSKYMRDQVMHIHREDERRIEIIPGGADGDMFQSVGAVEDRIRLREAFKIPKDTFVLFTAKRLYGGMGLENLVDMVELLVNDGKENVLLFLAGEGPLKKDLEQRIQEKGLSTWIRLLGNILHETIKYYYQMADLYISTWQQEPFGLVALEALSSGLPVLSCPEGGTAEILHGLSKDLLFQDSGPESMAEKITYFIDHPGELDDVRNKCRKYVEDNYTWGIAAKRFEQLFAKAKVK
ncbi:MAG: glycosyltransferase family 4 protein [Candidatus Brocadiaceae bacterium]|nr:glycosyltransferase family 4 protein [Candidatus Brocadiaceae bacterium]